ncbi:MAG TPA: arginine--tRNA ligase, partial [Candidatus Korarchaeota archaeon]|nr:arginine--tRNA ligase [Candidatus Korarchaeota archaeon]
MLDSRDPLGSLKEHIAMEIAEAASQLGLKVDPTEIPVQKTPSRDVGHLGSPIGFKLAGRLKMSPEEVSKSVVDRLNLSSIPIAASASPARGFVNFRFDEPTLIRAIIDAASSPEFGRGDVLGGVVMVEHTSANPAHPLHVGSGRNAVIGDSYARMLRHAGRKVETHYLVNDSGNQTILMSYGFSKVTGEKPKGKIDHWFG